MHTGKAEISDYECESILEPLQNCFQLPIFASKAKKLFPGAA